MSDSTSINAESSPSPEIFPKIGVLLGMTETSLLNLAQYGELEELGFDDKLIEEGANQTHFYIVLEGRIEIISHVSGRTTSLSEVQAGDSVGEGSLFESGPSQVFVRVLEETKLWKMSIASFHQFVTDHPGGGGTLLLGIAQCLSRRLREANQHILKNNIPPSFALPNYGIDSVSSSTSNRTQSFFSKLKSDLDETSEEKS